MILIDPIKDSDNTDDLNYYFCNQVVEYIKIKQGEANISRKSYDAPDITPLVLKNANSPTVYIPVMMAADVATYNINTDTYNALVGMCNYQLNDSFGAPEGSGFGITNELKIGSVSDIEVSLNPTKFTYIKTGNKEVDEEALKELRKPLDAIARHLVEMMYWYPVKNLTNPDIPNLYDPYFYRFAGEDSWLQESTIFKKGGNFNGSTGDIQEEDVDDKHKVRFLSLDSKIEPGSIYDIEQTGEEVDPETGEVTPVYDNPVLQHYTWRIPLIGVPSSARTVLLYARTKSSTVTAYIKLGTIGATYYKPDSTTKNNEYSDTTFTVDKSDFTKYAINIPYSGDPTSLEIGVQGNGKLDITAVWLVDSDTELHKFYPQGYRDEVPQEKIDIPPTEPCLAISPAKNADERALDAIGKVEPVPEQTTAEDPCGGSSPSSPEGFGSAIGGVLSCLTNLDPALAALADLNSLIKIDAKSIGTQIKALNDFTKMGKLSVAKDKLETVQKAASQQAKAIVNTEKDKVLAEAKALSPKNIKAAIPKPKIPNVPTPPKI